MKAKEPRTTLAKSGSQTTLTTAVVTAIRTAATWTPQEKSTYLNLNNCMPEVKAPAPTTEYKTRDGCPAQPHSYMIRFLKHGHRTFRLQACGRDVEHTLKMAQELSKIASKITMIEMDGFTGELREQPFPTT